MAKNKKVQEFLRLLKKFNESAFGESHTLSVTKEDVKTIRSLELTPRELYDAFCIAYHGSRKEAEKSLNNDRKKMSFFVRNQHDYSTTVDAIDALINRTKGEPLSPEELDRTKDWIQNSIWEYQLGHLKNDVEYTMEKNPGFEF